MIAMCGVTLYHAETDAESRTERYQRTYFPKAAVYQQTALDSRRSKNGPWKELETVIRIFGEEEIDMTVGDRMVLGSSAEAVPPTTSLQICGIADNRRGSRKVRHRKVVCR